MRRLCLIGPVVTAAVLVAPACALAGTASSYDVTEYSTTTYARYVAAQGEANDVAAYVGFGGVMFEDTGAPVSSESPCVQNGEHRAWCPGLLQSISALDGDDRISAPSGSTDGGDGHDVIHAQGSLDGGPGDDVLWGSDGKDLLDGGGGIDVLHGGAADDVLLDGDPIRGPADDDELHGGRGNDDAVYDRRAPISGDLARGYAGQAGERDRLSGIEGIGSARGPADLRGTRHRDFLSAGRGPSRVVAGRGDDQIRAIDLGPMVIRAGPGDDVIDREGQPVRGADIQCGRGSDTVSVPGEHDVLPPDCERAFDFDDAGVASARLRGRMPAPDVPFAWVNAWECDSADCHYTYEARRADAHGRLHELLARERRNVAGRHLPTVSLRLNAAGRRILATRGSMIVYVGYHDGPGGGLDGVYLRLVAP